MKIDYDEKLYSQLKTFIEFGNAGNIFAFCKPKPHQLTSFIVNEVEKINHIVFEKDSGNINTFNSFMTYYIGATGFSEFRLLNINASLIAHLSNETDSINSAYSYDGILIVVEDSIYPVKNVTYSSTLYSVLKYRILNNLRTIFVSSGVGRVLECYGEKYFSIEDIVNMGYKELTGIKRSCSNRRNKTEEELCEEILEHGRNK